MRPIIISGGADANTLLLLRFNDWIDSSKYERTVTQNLASDATALTDSLGGDPVTDAFGSYGYLRGATNLTNRSVTIQTDPYLLDLEFGNFTVETWMRRVGISNNLNYATMFSIVDNTPATIIEFGVAGLANTLGTSFRYADGSGATTTGVTITDTLWHHYAFVRDGSALYAYVDGVLSHTMALLPLRPFGSGSTWRIGTASGFGPNCHVDDFRISRVVRYFGDGTPPGPHKR